MRLLAALALGLVCAAAADGAGSADVAASAARTTAAGTARFTLSVSASYAGSAVRTREHGTIAFRRRRAHLYKLVPSEPVPQEQIVDGPLVYTNANVTAALSNPSVRPWTRVDTRRLPASRRGIGELDHVRALAYLARGLVGARTLGETPALVHLRGRVEPKRVLAGVPAAERAAIAAVLHADYTDAAFPAEVWLDRKGRVRRVLVSYRTAKGTRITISGSLWSFGTHVDVTPPPGRDVENVTP
jgi:hypothetical protein